MSSLVGVKVGDTLILVGMNRREIAAAVPRLRLRDGDIAELIVCLPEGRKSVEGATTWRA